MTLKHVKTLVIFVIIVFFLNMRANAEEDAGDIAKAWVSNNAYKLSKELAQATIQRTVHHLDLSALNTVHQKYQATLELEPVIEEGWHLLKFTDLKSKEFNVIRESSILFFDMSKQLHNSVGELGFIVKQIDEVEKDQTNLYENKNVKEYFQIAKLFPTLFLPNLQLLDGVEFGAEFGFGSGQTEQQQADENSANLLRAFVDGVKNIYQIYENSEIKDKIKEASEEFYEAIIDEPEYQELALAYLNQKEAKSLSLTRKIQKKINDVYDDAKALENIFNKTLVYLIDRRDRIIDGQLGIQLAKEKEEFDRKHYYPYLHPIELAFVKKQNELDQQYEELINSPEDPNFIYELDHLDIHRQAIQRLRLKWKAFQKEG
ncbi:MAG: hypothetical protein HYS98_09020 [Deltaproteobacteria bacterium]|nr:hypothetical protein [Deltaproteobacteria bacterium]